MAQDLKEVEKVLMRFRNYVIQQSRSNLSKSNKNDSKELYNSLKGEIVTENNYSIVGFSMAEYGQFVDKGVKGTDPSKVSKNAKITGQQAPSSPYRFGSGNFKGKWGDFTKKIETWAKKRNIRLRDEKGKFKEGNYKTIAQIIARNIYARGIKPSLFFTKPFEAGYKKYIDTDLMKAFSQDVDTIVDFNLKDIK
jgi:hypothetical protein